MNESQPERASLSGKTADLPGKAADLPEQTADDTDVGWGDWREDNTDAFYLENRPPHWD